jgi:DNA-directed RNA polymerase specialized sigma24 family protein
VDPKELARIWRHFEPPPPAASNGNPDDTAGLHLSEPGVVNGAAILLVCTACQRTVRRQPVNGDRSRKEAVTCTKCAKPREESALVERFRALYRRHPKHPGTGRILQPEEYSIFFAALALIDPDLWTKIGPHRVGLYAIAIKSATIERFLKLLGSNKLKTSRGKTYYSSPPLEKLIYKYGLEPKGHPPGEYPIDAAPYLLEALHEELQPILWPKRGEKGLKDYPWTFNNDQAHEVLYVRVRNRARRLVLERGEEDKPWGLSGHRYNERQKLRPQEERKELPEVVELILEEHDPLIDPGKTDDTFNETDLAQFDFLERTAKPLRAALSERRWQVLLYTAFDYDYKEIAEELNIAEATTRRHMQEARDQLQEDDALREHLLHRAPELGIRISGRFA